MKRFSKILAVLLILSVIPVSAATYQLVTASYPINVNGQKIAVTPLNLNGTTYLPLRSISEAVGVPIAWDNTKKSVEINTVDLDRLKEASVMIYADDGKTQVQGSAVFIDYDQALTAYHVVDENRSNVKTAAGDTLAIENFDSTLDIATLDSTKEIKPVKIGDSDEVKVGDKVIVIASPQGNQNSVIYGTVEEPSDKGMVIWCGADKGSSGGGVFNLKGELIGIIISGSGTDKANLAIPINEIRKAL
jgi:S1-C subfamily serine protease